MNSFDDILDVFVKELLEIIIVIIDNVKMLKEKYLNEFVKLIKEFKFKFEKLV